MSAVWQIVWELMIGKTVTNHGKSLATRPDPTVSVVNPWVPANSYPTARDL